MSWAEHLQKAKLHLKSSRLDDSLKEVNQALQVGGDREYTVYDSRAAIHERQGKLKSALQDVKNVIKLAPAHWQGYARASRLFLRVRKLDEAISMADMALARLDPNDSMRRAKLDELKEEVSVQQRQKIDHFGKLPVEIITTIFELVVGLDWSRVLNIRRVSKHWHDIALNTPRLWSTLVLTNRHPARHAQKWLERSKGRIHEIYLRSTLSHFPINLDGLIWERLRICKLENHDVAQYMGGKANLGRLSGLEELQVYNASSTCDPLLSIPHSKLQRLTLNASSFSWHILASKHHNLTSLEVQHPNPPPPLEEILAVLETNPMLEQLIISFKSGGPPSFSPSPPPLTMPNLHTLVLSKTPWAARFFVLVTMPHLQTLRLGTIGQVGLTPLVQQRPKLLELSVKCCVVSSADIITLLVGALTLKTLELVRLDGVSNDVVKALAAPSESTALCPSLSHLDVSHCPDVTTAPLVSLVNSRNNLPNMAVEPSVAGRIRTLITNGCPRIEAGSIPWIRDQVPTFSCIYLDKKAATWKR
ncbi:hypothetical protein DFH07DRAFT_1059835 [Mycena maculata]|uniref:F-box domain-containing protein n=1 Tax=Mycena maculata TaxID=230809 RepID=A0AAD7JDT2_9AGAR|nr:hypothetical protein DFH07DRAFT_1059835 [Mycena maculata]